MYKFVFYLFPERGFDAPHISPKKKNGAMILKIHVPFFFNFWVELSTVSQCDILCRCRIASSVYWNRLSGPNFLCVGPVRLSLVRRVTLLALQIAS